LRIEYKSKKLEKICVNAEVTTKTYGIRMAEQIQRCIDILAAADSVEMLIKYRIGRCHILKGKRKEQYAMDLTHPYRLIFIKVEQEIQIETIKIIEITDYH
jgi:proteic killer suppression protein